MSKRSRACEFSPKVRKEIIERDGGCCIFCRMFGYSGFPPSQISHFVPRSQGGVGVAKNGAYVCVKHHLELDNGKDGKTLLRAYQTYLEGFYPDWNKEDLIYDKWSMK